MINKYLLSNNKTKKEKQDLVSNNLIDLKTIASLNELIRKSAKIARAYNKQTQQGASYI